MDTKGVPAITISVTAITTGVLSSQTHKIIKN